MKETKNTTWKQKLSSSSTLKSEIKRTFADAKKYNSSHKDILNAIKSRVYEDAKYITLPNYMRSSINGYIEANFDMMYYFIEWVHWYDGKFVGKDAPYGEGFKQDLLTSSHVYKGTQDKY